DELILHAAARILAVDSEMYERETRRLRPEDRPTPEELRDAEFDVIVEPALPADEKVQAEIAEIWDRIGFARETVFGKAGAENPAAEVEKADEEAARAVATARARLQREAGELAPEDDPLGDNEDEEEG